MRPCSTGSRTKVSSSRRRSSRGGGNEKAGRSRRYRRDGCNSGSGSSREPRRMRTRVREGRTSAWQACAGSCSFPKGDNHSAAPATAGSQHQSHRNGDRQKRREAKRRARTQSRSAARPKARVPVRVSFAYGSSAPSALPRSARTRTPIQRPRRRKSIARPSTRRPRPGRSPPPSKPLAFRYWEAGNCHHSKCRKKTHTRGTVLRGEPDSGAQGTTPSAKRRARRKRSQSRMSSASSASPNKRKSCLGSETKDSVLLNDGPQC